LRAAIVFGLGPLEMLIFLVVALLLFGNFRGPKDPPSWGAERCR
jgi:hypothetical protein